ncbi:hypothetical protein GCM10022280_12660 [Sphingomonas swuensis]|uniref:DUF4198 domain-containing protein n=1 Tax=Sphingomonas swuensis TaxID=977800 RepID=A0ABP7SRW5_9SPHN
MKRFVLAALLLAGCDDDQPRAPTPEEMGPLGDPAVSTAWEIGPVINGNNYSGGAPLHPEQAADGLVISFPTPETHVHYVAFRHGSLAGKTTIRMRYRVEGGLFRPVKAPELPSIGPVLYFATSDNDWRSDGQRWWVSLPPMPIEPGEYELVASLKGVWGSVMTMTSANAAAFEAAKAKADRVGFTLGGGDGLGHGVTADTPSSITILSFEVL